MNTRRESQELIDKNQMKMDMQSLLNSINEFTRYELNIVEDETNSPTFVISIKYKSYQDDRMGFVHRITNLEASYLVKNIFENIKEIQGKDFILENNYRMSDPNQTQGTKRSEIRKQENYSSPIMDLYKEIYVEIRFYEGKGYM